jgi:hypothetical protein
MATLNKETLEKNLEHKFNYSHTSMYVHLDEGPITDMMGIHFSADSMLNAKPG